MEDNLPSLSSHFKYVDNVISFAVVSILELLTEVKWYCFGMQISLDNVKRA